MTIIVLTSTETIETIVMSIGIYTLVIIQMIPRTRPQPQPSVVLRPNCSPLKSHQQQNLPNNNTQFNTSRPLISPKKQHSQRLMLEHPPNTKSQRSHLATERSRPTVCCRHPNKKAEFRLIGEELPQLYCGRCAAQLATQGCKVELLESSTNSGMTISKGREAPRMPQYEGEPIYEQIVDILNLCDTVVGEHSANIERFTSLEEQYSQQADLTTAFYDRLIEIIEQMKEDHLSDLLQERDKYTQIADIENDTLRENIIEVNVIKNDIENHMQEVLEGIRASGDTAQCRESLQHYRQKLALFRHQTEEQLDTLAQTTRYSQSQIDRMMTDFQEFLKEMWGSHENPSSQPPQKQLNSAMTVKNIHQILPRAVAYQDQQSKQAFRNLESEEEENIEERKSPNFKRI